MPGIRCLEPAQLERFAGPDALPADAARLFDANPGLFASRFWWNTVLCHGLPAGSRGLFLLARLDARPVALWPLRRDPRGRLAALTTPYTCLYQPLFAPGLDAGAQQAVCAAFAQVCRGAAITRLDALDDAWPTLPVCIAAAADAGLVPLLFDCFGNWHEDVSGLAWPQYLAARPGALRETVRRRLRQAEREGGRFELVHDPAGVERGIAAYEQVYARSWKPAEPFPRFNPELMRAGAAAGWLRLGVLRMRGRPVAAQFWTMQHGIATVLKLAHDEAARALSPGTVLTAWMLRQLLDAEHVAQIDFGRGDDAYKQGWARQRRQRVGLILANPRHPSTWPLLLRHRLGRLRGRLAPGARGL